ncbi:MAG: hypothetical protein GYB55_14720 [Cytophagales bacterium]|uniref:hypothetical protein n=1 Tax=Cyclobacterium marinum TaxID=104 RepID=UPI0011EDCDDF|nr:hypothetical protein [Cyclobacterium marinum]MBI0401011.1 hypothetical protein [Cyclobacterium marinum]MBR9776194.1 hypothetical protein [Cytophagales bacterium]|tara:strand:+ start:175597 stop:175917 length:321 start_codon:yes stop_codon:yes gene_type:complete
MNSSLDNSCLIKTVAVDLNNLLQLPDLPEEIDREGLARAIEPVIAHLLSHEFERFLQLCYRFDLGEGKVKTILNTCPPEKVSFQMSLAIIDRQMLKVILRKKYSDY